MNGKRVVQWSRSTVVPAVPTVLLVLLTSACDVTQPGTELAFEGTVTDAVGDLPIDGAWVALFRIEFKGSSLLVSRHTDPEGQYSLRYSSDEPCPRLRLMASAPGYAEQSVSSFSSDDGVYPRCTDELQTFDFVLESLR